MRKLFVVSIFAAIGLGFTAPVMANYFWPGRIIIGYGGGGGGGGGGGDTTGGIDMKGEGPGDGCVLDHEIECECMPDKPVLDACKATGADIGCLNPDMKILGVSQEAEVVKVAKSGTLAGVVCGKVDKTAYIVLPKPY